MNRTLCVFSLVAALAVTFMANPAGAQSPEKGVHQAAAKKQKARRGESGYIACTFIGCIRIPPGCRPVTDYDFDGVPTGYDAVVCPKGKFYSRS